MRPDPNILLAANLLYATATNVANARAHLHHERRLIDGYPGGSDEPHVTATSETTPVERAVLARQQLDNRLTDLEAHIRGVLTMANDIHHTTQRILATRIEVARCTATGRDGAIIWGDPTCTSPPSRGTCCDRCSKREYRWRQSVGLPPRHDGVFAGDLNMYNE
ncbi:MAG TPA: hypothetical protein VNM92_00860 [Thermoanaerobaculia bacterium]|nr:hypothetical protein [Thermoanaerobaculia bacterium]